MAILNFFNFLMPMSAAINPHCDFSQDLEMGKEYYIYNPEYPSYYKASTSCRWAATSPVGTLIVITCDDIEIPPSKDCQADRLSISLTGDENLKDGSNYCGRTGKTLISTKNALTVGLFSSSKSSGGRFLCSLTAMQSGLVPTTTARPSTCNCGWRHESRIVGGHDTGVNEFPSMAAIIDTQTFDAFCGASIISERYSLTAAHCLINRAAPDLGLLVGDHNLSTGDDTDAAALYKVSKLVLHSQYDQATQHNDIGIVKTAKPIVFSLLVGPICLPFKYTWSNFNAQTVTALETPKSPIYAAIGTNYTIKTRNLGWGFTDFSGSKSDVLQGVDLSVVSNSFCSSAIPDPITEQQICTYATGKDSCLSDSGGPLLWQDAKTRKLQLVGVISYGVGCATTKPAVNTRVTSYLTWIVSETRDAVYCIK